MKKSLVMIGAAGVLLLGMMAVSAAPAPKFFRHLGFRQSEERKCRPLGKC